MMPALVAGSRFPVGSSARRIWGLLTTARAIATRCCSPPESSCGRRWALPSSPTILSTSGTASWMKPRDLPMTCRVKATFWKTFLLGRRRKSWKTTPRLRRKYGTLREEIEPRSCPSTWMLPLVGFSSFRMRRRQLDLPEPDAPTRKTNSPRSTSRLMPFSAGRVVPEYCLDTCSNRIMTSRDYASSGASAVSARAWREPDSAPSTGSVRGQSRIGYAWASALAPARQRMPAAMKPSRSPSKTELGLPDSYPVRRSLTSCWP